MKYQEGDLTLCTVDKVENNITFVHLPDETKGTIISSEIAPGRIKHMRAYVVPNKIIVCKVLSISKDNIHLSLRRVSAKEKSEIMKEHKQTLAIKSGMKQLLKEDYEKTKEKILKDYNSIEEFAKEARKDIKLVEKYVPKKSLEQILKLFEKRKKEIELKYILQIKCMADNGVNKIKELLKLDNEKTKVNYISAGKFALKLTAEDFKQGKQQMQSILEDLTRKAKKIPCDFEYKEEKQ
jgi:translation initiation factor 2 alpha subunit (eIF-2alpha)